MTNSGDQAALVAHFYLGYMQVLTWPGTLQRFTLTVDGGAGAGVSIRPTTCEVMAARI
jgi:hypothetical protein